MGALGVGKAQSEMCTSHMMASAARMQAALLPVLNTTHAMLNAQERAHAATSQFGRQKEIGEVFGVTDEEEEHAEASGDEGYNPPADAAAHPPPPSHHPMPQPILPQTPNLPGTPFPPPLPPLPPMPMPMLPPQLFGGGFPFSMPPPTSHLNAMTFPQLGLDFGLLGQPQSQGSAGPSAAAQEKAPTIYVCNHQGLSGDNEVVVCACTFTKVNDCTGHRSKCRALNLYDKGGYPPSNGAAVHKSALNFKFALSKMTSSDPTLGVCLNIIFEPLYRHI